MTTCWQYAFRMENGCESSTFDCANQHRNATLLNDSCPISLPNATIFDFAIFLHVLRHDISGSRNFPRKFSNCFWWGFRNLRSISPHFLAFFWWSHKRIAQLLLVYLIWTSSSHIAGLHLCSSLGSNLQASINTWENLFAASISVIGLLLFLYLIGNLQVGAKSFSFSFSFK